MWATLRNNFNQYIKNNLVMRAACCPHCRSMHSAVSALSELPPILWHNEQRHPGQLSHSSVPSQREACISTGKGVLELSTWDQYSRHLNEAREPIAPPFRGKTPGGEGGGGRSCPQPKINMIKELITVLLTVMFEPLMIV